LSDTSRRALWLAVLCTAVFSAGLIRLFLLRFGAGDVYPAYSSLRTDPLGTRALYESLSAMPHTSVQRHFRPLDKLALAPDVTILICGQDPGDRLQGKIWQGLTDNLAAKGGRLIIALHAPAARASSDAQAQKEGCPPRQKKSDDGDSKPEKAASAKDETEKWRGAESLGIEWQQATAPARIPKALKTPAASLPLPDAIPWYSDLFFQVDDGAWQTIYTWQDKPVLVSRPWGRGTIVLVGDSYLFSNEALRKDRRAGFFVWAAAPGGRVVFDEFHLGLANQPGIAGLARKYGLEGVIAVVILIAVLLIWQQAAAFRPRRAASDTVDVLPAAGRDTREGLAGLMQQHIAADNILQVCLDAWKPSAAARRLPTAKIVRVQEMVAAAAGRGDPVGIYRQISELLEQGKRS
jgi:hypothetical protein